jgi:hypothetical protein
MYADGVWKLCHDFGSLHAGSADLTELVDILVRHRKIVRKEMIVDVKWDWVWNKEDDLSVAIAQLKAILGGKDLPVWVQACCPRALKVLSDQDFHDKWKVGMIVVGMEQFHAYKDKIHYAMVSLHEFTPAEFEEMGRECELVGYTCAKPAQLPLYKHLYPHLSGIVCDIPV